MIAFPLGWQVCRLALKQNFLPKLETEAEWLIRLTGTGRYRLALPPPVTSVLGSADVIFPVTQMPDFHLTPVI